MRQNEWIFQRTAAIGPAHRDEWNRNLRAAAKRASAGCGNCSAFRSGEGISHQNVPRERMHGTRTCENCQQLTLSRARGKYKLKG